MSSQDFEVGNCSSGYSSQVLGMILDFNQSDSIEMASSK